ncbi:MAG: hypothetical protein A4S09_04020 [Proteobacteria bacterium SG_bin7]|nr:MAG: hypothetical protein A4S09_04020 [Proteobacteria bacterium SG_bin7]
MDYLVRHRDIKANLKTKYLGANSAIVMAYPYVPHPSKENNPFPNLNVALYAQGLDYHNWLKKKVEEIIAKLKEHFPNENFWSCTDSSPVLERDLAQNSGLGWFGKNTCLIDRKAGSFFFICEIVTTLNLEPSVSSPKSFCGTCTRCIDSCPTNAIISPHVLDARRCISYLTIEAKSIAKAELRPLIGSHFFGCDICQTVCPWNEELEPYMLNQDGINELQFILDSSDEELKNKIRGTALERAKPLGLKRNALIVTANQQITSLKHSVKRYLGHKILRELTKWALERLHDQKETIT